MSPMKNFRPGCDQILREKSSWALDINKLEDDFSQLSVTEQSIEESFHKYFIKTKLNVLVEKRQKLKASSIQSRIETTNRAISNTDSSTIGRIVGNFDISSATLKSDSIASAASNETDSSTKQFSNDGRYKNEFQELEWIGGGTFGQVYKALNILDEQSYAVKKVEIKGTRF